MTRAETAVVKVENLSKVFYTQEVETHALSKISLEVQKGEYLSIGGPSGCGKSTLLFILGLLDSPTSGRYWLSGTEISDINALERARIRNLEMGFIFQSFNLIGEMTVEQNVGLPLSYRDNINRHERQERAAAALERVNMLHRLNHFPAQLSGGQQQRIAVARALVGEPKILLADEPTGNLDSTNGEAVMELLGELHASGATICMVTHDTRYAEFAQRNLHLFDGKVVDEETLHKLREQEEGAMRHQARGHAREPGE